VDVGGRIGVPQATAMTYNADDDVAVGAAYALAGSAMTQSRAGLAPKFTDEDRRQARGGKRMKK
jgi:hypothetical protein